MGLPLHKTIKINGVDEEFVLSQLDNIDFSERPITLDLLHLGTDQLTVIEVIDQFFYSSGHNFLSYPVYVLSTCPDYDGQLRVISDEQHLPKFFFRKVRSLNVKENNLVKKAKLIQESFANIQVDEAYPLLEEYSRTHEIIEKLAIEEHFYQKLTQKLKEENE